MNIALFTDTFVPQVNGVANTVLRSAKTLSDLGHNICVYTISKNTEIELKKIVGEKIKIFTAPSIDALVYKGERFTLPLGFSLKHMREFKPDVIHTHTPFSIGWEAVLSAKILKIPLVGTHHTFFDHYLRHIYLDYNWLRGLTWKYTVGYYNRCHTVISPTQSLSSNLKDNGLKKDVEIVPNPIDINFFSPVRDKDQKQKLKNKLKLEGRILVYMGRISYEKSIDQVIKATSLITKQSPDVKLVIIGDGPEKEKLIKLSRDLNISDKVIFTGYLFGKELVEYLQASDIFLLGSKSENMPLAVLEAMAVGLPILSVSSLGMNEIVKNNENGYLLRTDNPQNMAEKTIELLNNEVKLKSFSKKSREMSLNYSDLKSTEKILEIYKKII